MPKERAKKIPFPASGLNEDSGFDLQVPLTTNVMLNVRSRETLEGRVRGGNRPWLSKWFPTAINGTAAIQNLIKVVRPQAYPTINDEFLFGNLTGTTSPFGSFNSDLTTKLKQFWDDSSSPTHAVVTDGTNYYIGGEGNTISGFDSGTENSVWKVDNSGTNPASNAPTWGFHAGGTFLGLSCVGLRFDKVNNRVYVAAVRTSNWEGAGGTKCVFALNAATGAVIWSQDLGEICSSLDYNVKLNELIVLVAGPNSSWAGAGGTKNIFRLNADTGAILSTYNSDITTAVHTEIRSRASDGRVLVYFGPTGNFTTWDGNDGSDKNVFILDSKLTLLSTFRIGVGLGTSNAGLCGWVGLDGNWLIGNDALATGAITVYDSAGTQLWQFGPGDKGFSVQVGEFGDIGVTAPANASWTGQDGTKNMWILNESTGAVKLSANNSDFATANKSAMSSFSSGDALATRETSLLITAGGTIKKIDGGILTSPTGGGSILTDQPLRIMSTQITPNVFYIDGVDEKYYDLVAGTVKDWATDITAGILPTAPRLMVRWRGRIVFAGFVADAANWSMSKLGDPFNWDFSPATVTDIDAVIGNASDAGLVGDVVTCLMPVSDDELLIGGDQSLWVMSGDPQSGGRLDEITDKIGVAWNAWTSGPDGEVYFLGRDGVYRYRSRSDITKITSNRLDERFKQLDMANLRALLEWDTVNQTLQIVFATPGATVHTAFCWESRTDSWSEEQYPVAMGPIALYAYDAEAVDDTELLFGCRDGIIRQFDNAVSDDDGTAGTAKFRYSPIPLGQEDKDGILAGVNITLGKDSDDVTMNIYTGRTAEECLKSTTVRFARTLTDGRNAVSIGRVRGKWMQIELKTTVAARWAIEEAYVTRQTDGSTGRHKR